MLKTLMTCVAMSLAGTAAQAIDLTPEMEESVRVVTAAVCPPPAVTSPSWPAIFVNSTCWNDYTFAYDQCATAAIDAYMAECADCQNKIGQPAIDACVDAAFNLLEAELEACDDIAASVAMICMCGDDPWAFPLDFYICDCGDGFDPDPCCSGCELQYAPIYDAARQTFKDQACECMYNPDGSLTKPHTRAECLRGVMEQWQIKSDTINNQLKACCDSCGGVSGS